MGEKKDRRAEERGREKDGRRKTGGREKEDGRTITELEDGRIGSV